MGDTEVHNLGAVVGHEDVGGFEVTVDDPSGPHGHESLGKTDCQADQPLALQWAMRTHEIEQVPPGTYSVTR